MSAVIQASTGLVESRGFKRLIDVAALAPDGLGDLGGAHPFLAQRHDVRAVESGRAALVNPLRLCGLDASALPVADEAKLHLCDHAIDTGGPMGRMVLTVLGKRRGEILR
jgi:hypothetical protein